MINLLSAFPITLVFHKGYLQTPCHALWIEKTCKRRRFPAPNAVPPTAALAVFLPSQQYGLFGAQAANMALSRRKFTGSLSNRRRLKKRIAKPLAFLNHPNPYAA
jgi:hypothetical protein